MKTAERIAGLEFTDAERDLLLDGVNQHLPRFETMRTIPLPNGVPSCLRFSPITPGVKFDTVRRPVRMSKPPPVKRPANLEEAAFWPVTHLSQLIKTRQAAQSS